MLLSNSYDGRYITFLGRYPYVTTPFVAAFDENYFYCFDLILPLLQANYLPTTMIQTMPISSISRPGVTSTRETLIIPMIASTQDLQSSSFWQINLAKKGLLYFDVNLLSSC